MTGISNKTLTKFKEIFLIKARDEYCDNICKIREPGHIVQIDETVVCRGRIIRNTTSFHDTAPGRNGWSEKLIKKLTIFTLQWLEIVLLNQ